MTAQRGDNRQRAREVLHLLDASGGARDVKEAVISVALDEAEERGRQSVGLGDFLPNPCGDEYSSYPHYIAETYGDYVTCSRRRGHDGQHEHSDSGMTWSTR